MMAMMAVCLKPLLPFLSFKLAIVVSRNNMLEVFKKLLPR